VYSQQIYDQDGPGGLLPTLIIGGNFLHPGGGSDDAIASWDGYRMSPLGQGLQSQNPQAPFASVASMTVFDPDGPGPLPPQLVVGGYFDHAGGVPVHNLAVWNGQTWAAIPDTPTGPVNYFPSVSLVKAVNVPSVAASGPRLYVVIWYLDEVFSQSTQLWIWDGSTWTQSGAGTPNAIQSLEFFDADGTGTALGALYAHWSYTLSHLGYFAQSSGLSRLIASGWETVVESGCQGDPPPFPLCDSYARLAQFDADGPGPAGPVLVVSGTFESIGGVPAHNLAAYDGAAWSAFAGGLDGGAGYLIAAADPVTSRGTLYVSGQNLASGGVDLGSLGRYDANSGWTPVVGSYGPVRSVVPFNVVGQLPASYFGAPRFAGVPVPGVGRLTSVGWAPIGQCLNNEVHALGVYTEPGGVPSLYAGGAFTAAGGQLAVGLAKWDGSNWSPAANLNNHVDCMVPFGDSLAIGGKFTINGLPTGGVALYRTGQISYLGVGMDTPVHALAVFNNQLYAGGEFTMAGAASAIGVARWTGSQWTPVGGGPGSGTDNHVDAMAVFDDGTGAKLYIGGKFTHVNQLETLHIAKWDGAAWTSVGEGFDGDVEALAVADVGGPALFAGGSFTHSGSTGVSRIAVWRPRSGWSPLGAGVDGTVRALSGLDSDGPGNAPGVLVVGGDFTSAAGMSSPHTAIWNGQAWEVMGVGTDGTVLAAASFQPDAAGAGPPQVYLGGSFLNAGGRASPYIASWLRCPSCYANCDGSTTPPVLNIGDFVCFQSRFAAGDAAANCDGSTAPPVLNVADFICFQQAFAAGCP
jgi:hypothetical protein